MCIRDSFDRVDEETIKILLISISSISRGIISSTLWSQYTLSSGEYAKGSIIYLFDINFAIASNASLASGKKGA